MKPLHYLGLLTLILIMSLTACNFNAEKQDDGSWDLTINISESDVQQAISAALADPLISNLRADFKPGYVYVTADRKNVEGTRVDPISFKVTFGVISDHLSTTVSDAMFGSYAVDAATMAVWNQRISNHLEAIGTRNPDSKLKSINVTESSMSLVWNSKTRR